MIQQIEEYNETHYSSINFIINVCPILFLFYLYSLLPLLLLNYLEENYIISCAKVGTQLKKSNQIQMQYHYHTLKKKSTIIFLNHYFLISITHPPHCHTPQIFLHLRDPFHFTIFQKKRCKNNEYLTILQKVHVKWNQKRSLFGC